MSISGQVVPCGRCLACHLNRRRIWKNRILLEASQQEDNAFLTLTYSDDYLVMTADGVPTLSKTHLSSYMKRLRTAISPRKVRYYGCGEYGTKTQRPHYHAVLFGYPACLRGETRHPASQCCAFCAELQAQWSLGDIHLGSLTADSAQYVAGYVVKKFVNRNLISERLREYSRMSRRPGIGVGLMHEVASVLLEWDYHLELEDVPESLAHGKSALPIGRVLKRKLRELIGREPQTPQSVLDRWKAEVQPVRQAAFDSSRSFAEVLREVLAGDAASLEAREGVFGQKRERL